MRIALALVLWVGCTAPAPLEEPSYDAGFGAMKRTQVGRYRVGLELDPSPPVLGELFRVQARVELKDGTPLETAVVDLNARMPEHEHGMETRPRVRPGACSGDTDAPPTRCPHPGGLYIADGFKFHMSGSWTVSVELDGPAGPDSTDFVVVMP